MRNKILIPIAVLVSLAFLSSFISYNSKGTSQINIKGSKHNKGNARILLFNEQNKQYFPDKSKKTLKQFERTINNKKLVISIKDIPNGKYAVSVHHDENADNKLNTNWLGIPNEGIGASNDAEGNLGPPEFEDAAFVLVKSLKSITINMKY